MTDYEKALADARDALAIYRRYGAPLCGYATNAIDALDDLLAALDAAPQAPPAAVAPKLEHKASADCWCEPELDSVDPDTGAKVWVHRETH